MLLIVVRSLLLALCGILLPCVAIYWYTYHHGGESVFALGGLAVLFLICFLVAAAVQGLPSPWQLWAAVAVILAYVSVFAGLGYQMHRAMTEYRQTREE